MPPISQPVADERVAAVRRFNRFYTRRIGVLDEGYLASPFSLTEVRVLYELSQRDAPTAAELGRDLGLDRGYLSRMLHRFVRQGLVDRTRSATDSRRQHLALTRSGEAAFAPLDARAREQIASMLAGVPGSDQERLLSAMKTIEKLLGGGSDGGTPYALRSPRPGDLGWVVHRHGVLYAREYGWDESFEALVAEIVARFARSSDPGLERCWIAERDGEIVGTVLAVRRSRTIAQLRLLLVEPNARGLGIGTRLVAECVRFARRAGYRKIVLWTNDVLVEARRLYEAAGFRLVAEEPHHSFGHDLVGQNWELDLAKRRPPESERPRRVTRGSWGR